VQQLENSGALDGSFLADADWMNDAVARGIVDPSTPVAGKDAMSEVWQFRQWYEPLRPKS
jgi:hypothetical protein